MGTRYFIEVCCPKCGHWDHGVYYAPTCGFTKTTCEKCGKRIDLEKYTGIPREEASNRAGIEAMAKALYADAKVK